MRHPTALLPSLLSLSVHLSPASSFTPSTLLPKHSFLPSTVPGSKFSLYTSKPSSNTAQTNNNEESTLTNDDDNNDMKVPPLPEIPPMSKRLFLVRHGEVINPGGDRPVFYGAMDVPLSPLGELEAKAAAAYLKRFDLHTVAASTLSRAIFGANEVLCLQKNKSEEEERELVLYDGFRELDRGAWCGKTLDEIGPELMGRFDACDESVTPEGGESYPFLKERVGKARDELLSVMPCGEAGALVSHLQVTRSMLSDALGIPTNEMVNLKVATASVTCIDYCQVTGDQTVHFQSFKPDVGLEKSKDGAN